MRRSKPGAIQAVWRRRKELALLLALLVPVAGLWAFFELVDEVREQDTQALDTRVLLALRNPADPADPIGPEWIEEAGRDLTALGGVAVLCLVTAGVSGFLVLRRHFRALVLMLVATLGGMGLGLWVKTLIDRPRPELVPHLSYAVTASFPSGHSMLSAIVYVTLAALAARLVTRAIMRVYLVGCALLATFLVGVSRVYLGVHYPTDVLAGWTLGLAWAVLCWLVARYLQRRGAVEEPDERASAAPDD